MFIKFPVLTKQLWYLPVFALLWGCIPASKIDTNFTSGDIWLEGDDEVSLLLAGALNPDGALQAYDWKVNTQAGCPVNALDLFDEAIVYQLSANLLHGDIDIFDPVWQNKASDLLGLTHLVYFTAEEIETGNPLGIYLGEWPDTASPVGNTQLHRVRVNVTFYDLELKTVAMQYGIKTQLNPYLLALADGNVTKAINLGSARVAVNKGLSKAFRNFKRKVRCL